LGARSDLLLGIILAQPVIDKAWAEFFEAKQTYPNGDESNQEYQQPKGHSKNEEEEKNT
jgi:hypothetical protein